MNYVKNLNFSQKIHGYCNTYKILTLLLILLILSLNLSDCFYKLSYAKTLNQNTFNYIGNITSLTLNPLLAFENTYYKNHSKNELYLTPEEFINLLNNLNKKNFVLINPLLISPKFVQDNKIKLTLPINKKPLILNFKNLSYSNKNMGFIDKFILDRNNQISTYTKQEYVHDRVSLTNDFLPILENFIENNPEFSYKNARANLIVNGSEGLLGYEIQPTSAHYKYERREISKILKRLRKLNYRFIYGGYNNQLYFSLQTPKTLNSDFENYKKYVAKFTEKNNFIYTTPQNLDHYKEILNQNYIVFIEDKKFNTYKTEQFVIITTLAITPLNLTVFLQTL